MYIKYFKKQFCTFATTKIGPMIQFYIQKPGIKISNRRAIKNWIKEVLQENNKCPGEINIIVCDSEYVLELNNKFLGHNYCTDVITFPYTEPTEQRLSGDVFVDIETVAKNAKLYRQTINNEFLRVVIHGILHMTGMQDGTKEEKLKMREAEDKALRNINVNPFK